MSQATARAKYRSALRRFNSPSLSQKQRENAARSQASATAQYSGFNGSTGEHEVINPEGELIPVVTPQNKPMGIGDDGYVNQGFFVL